MKYSEGDIPYSSCKALNVLMAGPTIMSSSKQIPLDSYCATTKLGKMFGKLIIGRCIVVVSESWSSKGLFNKKCHACVVALIVGDNLLLTFCRKRLMNR